MQSSCPQTAYPACCPQQKIPCRPITRNCQKMVPGCWNQCQRMQQHQCPRTLQCYGNRQCAAPCCKAFPGTTTCTCNIRKCRCESPCRCQCFEMICYPVQHDNMGDRTMYCYNVNKEICQCYMTEDSRGDQGRSFCNNRCKFAGWDSSTESPDEDWEQDRVGDRNGDIDKERDRDGDSERDIKGDKSGDENSENNHYLDKDFEPPKDKNRERSINFSNEFQEFDGRPCYKGGQRDFPPCPQYKSNICSQRSEDPCCGCKKITKPRCHCGMERLDRKGRYEEKVWDSEEYRDADRHTDEGEVGQESKEEEKVEDALSSTSAKEKQGETQSESPDTNADINGDKLAIDEETVGRKSDIAEVTINEGGDETISTKKKRSRKSKNSVHSQLSIGENAKKAESEVVNFVKVSSNSMHQTSDYPVTMLAAPAALPNQYENFVKHTQRIYEPEVEKQVGSDTPLGPSALASATSMQQGLSTVTISTQPLPSTCNEISPTPRHASLLHSYPLKKRGLKTVLKRTFLFGLNKHD